MDESSRAGLLEALWGAVAEGLLKKLQDGAATGTDFANAIKLLKDNGITIDVRPGAGTPESKKALDDILSRLPDFSAEDSQ